MDRRLDVAGAGRAEAPNSLAISLMWEQKKGRGPFSKTQRNDLDLWVTAPSGEKIGFLHKKSKCGGELDVDRLEDDDDPVENIVWGGNAPRGKYEVLEQVKTA